MCVNFYVMSFTEQNVTPPPNQNSVQADLSAEIHPCGESPQKSSALLEEMNGEIPSEEDSDSDSDSESDSESYSDPDSRSESGSGSVVLSEESPFQPSEETSSENLKDHVTPEKTSPREPDSKLRKESLAGCRTMFLFEVFCKIGAFERNAY